MARVFVIGYSIPKYSKNKISAVNYRTWQFLKPLLEEGHELCLIALGNEVLKPDSIEESNLQVHTLNTGKLAWKRTLQKAYDRFSGDCVLAVGTGACYVASFLKNNRPMWMDIYGDPVMESQIRLYARNTNKGLFTVIGMEKTILKKGNKFSCLSNPQKYALIGKLGLLGRLIRENTGYEFVHTILPGMDSNNCPPSGSGLLKGNLVEEDDFVVLWAGGYNAWADITTLFKGLEYAMERNAKIKFVSFGVGAVVDPQGYPEFLSKIEASKYKDRFIMRGWLSSQEDVLAYYREADLGISVDRNCYETLIGSRTRLVEMLSCRLPVISTEGCELAAILTQEEVCRTFPIGDFTAMGETILKLSESNILKETVNKKFEQLSNIFSFEITTSPFRRWAANPGFSPDKNVSNFLIWRERLRGFLRSAMVRSVGLLGK